MLLLYERIYVVLSTLFYFARSPNSTEHIVVDDYRRYYSERPNVASVRHRHRLRHPFHFLAAGAAMAASDSRVVTDIKYFSKKKNKLPVCALRAMAIGYVVTGAYTLLFCIHNSLYGAIVYNAINTNFVFFSSSNVCTFLSSFYPSFQARILLYCEKVI